MKSHQARITPIRRGVTLVEAMCTLAVIATAAGVAVPGLEGLRADRSLDGVAAQLESAVHLARSEAVARNQPVRLTIGTQTNGTCYVVHTGPRDACHCTNMEAPRCDGDAQLIRSVRIDASQPVQVRSAVGSMLFDPVKGTTTPTATLRVVAKDGRAVHQVVNLLGRVRSCTPGSKVQGYKTC
jgi:type IV fimbrial biogenesis protein FimT